MRLFSVAYGAVDTLPSQSFFILLFNFSALAMQQNERMMLACVMDLATAVETPSFSPPQQPPMRAFKRKGESSHRGLNSAKSDTDTDNGKDKAMTSDLVGAVQNKPSTNREIHVKQPVRIRPHETAAPKADSRREVLISAKCQSYRKPSISKLLKFQTIWLGHVGRIDIAKQRIELLSTDAAPAHFAPCRALLRTRKFKKAKIEKMLAENITKPTQTKCVAPIIFVPKKDVTLLFCSDYCKINAVTRQNSYPILRTHECIFSLVEAIVSSALDPNSRHWQTKVEDNDKYKTAFRSHC